ncbi:OmpA family protein [Rhodobacteraceae bacterium 10Alg 79]|uniref:OmpA family protein n=1 Tax=Rhodalgimonas zhirmunskyi TaxID=2964767 RepID=A0AAJ1X6S0_9RHOB|nr:OmpA family protein [Rhodoalgimonas zhirmunskyi]
MLTATAVSALDLTLPSNARQTASQTTAPDSARLPVAPFANGELPALTVEGRVSRTAWRIDAQGLTTLQLMAPLRAQLEKAGYEVLLDCASARCGGFDFRFGLRVIPEPDMHVDLFDYRYLLATHEGEGGESYAAILTSRSARAGYVQITLVTPAGAPAPGVGTGGQTARPTIVTPVRPDGATGSALPLVQALTTEGHAVLSDLDFKTGSSNLGDAQFASLATLAAWLKADPTRRIALVGHTDATGSLEGNIALSKRRAGSVRDRLAEAYGVPRAQMQAEGMGYLAPITTNLTAEGREKNRRVEAILLNTQ